VLLGQKYAGERRRNGEIAARLEALQQAALQARALVAEHARLSKAHAAQARLVQQLQDENAEIGLFRATIKTQEKVILKLEDLLESKLRESSLHGGAQGLMDEVERLKARNKDLENKLINGDFVGDSERTRILENQLDQAREQLRDSARSRRPEADGGDEDKVKALEEQLVNNAKNFAREISGARMRVFELEAQLEAMTGGASSPAP
jgi:hypothetical protein